MKSKAFMLSAMLLAFAPVVWGATHYVNLNNLNPVAPYTDWSTAAISIQDAIDAAADGDEVTVTNGVYAEGGRVVSGTLTNRVVVDKAITVQSVNGPEFTVIEGNSSLGDDAVRCVYLSNDAALFGFTLTNGATLLSFSGQSEDARRTSCSGAGVWSESTSAVISNCVLVANSAEYAFGGMGGGAYSGTLINCVLSGNKSVNGGGAFESVLTGCVLTNNLAVSSSLLTGGSSMASSGGGAQSCFLTNCVLVGNESRGIAGAAGASTLSGCTVQRNRAGANGGGVYASTVMDSSFSENSSRGSGGGVYSGFISNCILVQNFAASGAGMAQATAANCRLENNRALIDGGGAYQSTLNNCALLNNFAQTNGGGAAGGILIHCTLAGNSAFAGGGSANANLTNCIVFYNQATNGANHQGGHLEYSCSMPLPLGTGNIDAAPVFADAVHLASISPCIGAGTSSLSNGADIDGESWPMPPSMGCDEFAAAHGPLAVAIHSDYFNARPGAPINFTENIKGIANESIWDFGDGMSATNQPYISHIWNSPGVYSVTLTAFNADNPTGISKELEVQILEAPVLYVSQNSLNPTAPFLSWETAATSIQDAVDAGFAGGSTVIVSNGTYRTGGKTITGVLSNRVCLDKPITVQSLNGPEFTFIEGGRLGSQIVYSPSYPSHGVGDDAVRCAYLCDGGKLIGFTLTNGATRAAMASVVAEYSGGGAWCESSNAFLINCTIVSNVCSMWGAGVFSGTLSNCQVMNNWNLNGSLAGGGGVAFSIVVDSQLEKNRASQNGGGGAISSTLSNCVVSLNTSEGVVDCTLYDCEVTANNGPGMIRGMAFNSIISSNVSFNQNLGGGATSATLSNCFVFNNSARNGGGAYNCVLNFCTVSNNEATFSGGGFYWGGTAPFQIESPGKNSIILGNTAGGSGGGGASGITFNLTNWVFSNNSAVGSGGGFASGNAVIVDCVFNGNYSGGFGGGISGASRKVQLIGCTIFSNSAVGNGGGASDVDLQGCLFSDNSAGSLGGGASARTAVDSAFLRNTAIINGGGLFLQSNLGITNCLFEENSAGSSGGGLHASAGSIKNSRFSRNSAGSSGGGIYLISSSILVTNCTLVDNRAKFGGGGYNGFFAGCTIQGNFATNNGGGVCYQSPFESSASSNNVIVGNSAVFEGGGAFGGNWQRCTISSNSAGNGGGLSTARLDHSVVWNNTAKTNGGGVYLTPFNNCLFTGNEAQRGGAAYNANQQVSVSTISGNSASISGGGIFAGGMQLMGSIVYFNTAPAAPNYTGTINSFSCLTPLPAGTGNIDSDPGFIDSANGNFRLQTNSPCINTGGGPSSPDDLDGRPRFVGGHIDMGAFEFQGPGVGEFIGWLQQNGLPTSGAADHQDTDIDRMDNWQEWIAGTSPTNAASLLQMYSPSNSVNGITVAWQSVSGKNYFVQRSSDLTAQPAFSSIESNLVGQADITSFTDSTATNHSPYFYRVGVQ